jgi:hypothetical protein
MVLVNLNSLKRVFRRVKARSSNTGNSTVKAHEVVQEGADSICYSNINGSESRGDFDEEDAPQTISISDSQSPSDSCSDSVSSDDSEDSEEERVLSVSTDDSSRSMDHPDITCQEQVNIHISLSGSIDVERVPSIEIMPVILSIIRLRPKSTEDEDNDEAEEWVVDEDEGEDDEDIFDSTDYEEYMKENDRLETQTKTHKKEMFIERQVVESDSSVESQYEWSDMDDERTLQSALSILADLDDPDPSIKRPPRGRSRRPRSPIEPEPIDGPSAASSLPRDQSDLSSISFVSVMEDPAVRCTSPIRLHRSLNKSFVSIKHRFESVAKWSKRDQFLDIVVIEDCATDEMEEQMIVDLVAKTPPMDTKSVRSLSPKTKLKGIIQAIHTEVKTKQEKLQKKLAVQYQLHKRLVKKKKHVNRGSDSPKEFKPRFQKVKERIRLEKEKVQVFQKKARKSLHKVFDALRSNKGPA